VNNFWPQWQLQKPVFTDSPTHRLKEIAIAQHRCRKHSESKQAALEREFCNLQSRADPNNADHCCGLLKIKDLLQAMDDEMIEGCILRSKEQWTELGEKPTRYFY